MADTKRNVAGKVATSKASGASTAPPMLDTLEALGKAIGARIKLTTAAPHSQSHEGTLFTACPILNVVAINTRNTDSAASTAAQAGDYHITPVSRIQSIQVISLASGAENSESSYASAQPAIGPVDVKRREQRVADRVRQLKEEEKNMGRGVTKEAQAIYDSFKRINMPIRWHNQEMIVHEAIIIAPPYRSEDCKGAKEKQEVLNRVKKVLEGERRKLKEREERERKSAATPTGPRKGG
ncbi:hypothetical protein LTR85_007553 [Meristemomyces frigidus]|nr:hypothetical protein LTR85_007553 [Meristemomyces frigidus]